MKALAVQPEDEERENEPQRAQIIREAQALAVESLTPTQLRRLSSRLEGKSLATIAESENCSVQSVHETLRVPKVAATFEIMGQTLAAKDRETGEDVNLLLLLLENVWSIATHATRAVQINGTIEHVPDYPTRLAASTRLLSLAKPLQRSPETPLRESAA